MLNRKGAIEIDRNCNICISFHNIAYLIVNNRLGKSFSHMFVGKVILIGLK